MTGSNATTSLALGVLSFKSPPGDFHGTGSLVASLLVRVGSVKNSGR